MGKWEVGGRGGVAVGDGERERDGAAVDGVEVDGPADVDSAMHWGTLLHERVSRERRAAVMG